jgi:hypothetical protein
MTVDELLDLYLDAPLTGALKMAVSGCARSACRRE